MECTTQKSTHDSFCHSCLCTNVIILVLVNDSLNLLIQRLSFYDIYEAVIGIG